MPAFNATLFTRPAVYVRRVDLPELWLIAAEARKTSADAQLFLEEFDRLSVAPPWNDDHFVRLGSSVTYKDLRTKRQRRVRLVRPGSENPDENDISLLSPIGSALVGLAEGAIFRWQGVDSRLRAIKVVAVDHQDAR